MIFLDENHIYHKAGVEVPGVTDVLERAGLIDARWFDDHSRDRGTAVHSACALYDWADLDEDSIDPDVAPYLAGWIRFKDESGFEPTMIEEIVYNPTFGYAGTLDRVGKMNGQTILADIKSGAVQRWCSIQTSAYAGCLSYPVTRFAVELHENGTYKLIKHDNRQDWQVWLSCLAIHNWKSNGGKA